MAGQETAAARPSVPRTLAVTVIIPTIVRSGLLEQCLRSVLACDPGPAEVLLVDQSATGEAASIASATGDGRPRVVRAAPRGIAAATNLGLRSAGHDAVLVTHDDCTVAPDWVARAWQHVTERPAGLVTGRVLPGAEGRSVPSTMTSSVAQDWTGWLSKGALWPNNMAGSRSEMLAIGGFDERPSLRLAAEDNDFCYRWAREGRSLRYEPAMVVWHHDWRSTPELRSTYATYARGQGAFYGKHLAKSDWNVLPLARSDVHNGVRPALRRLGPPSLREPPTPRGAMIPWLFVGMWRGWREERRYQRDGRRALAQVSIGKDGSERSSS